MKAIKHSSLIMLLAVGFMTSACGSILGGSKKSKSVDVPTVVNRPIITTTTGADIGPHVNLRVLSYNSFYLPADDVSSATAEQRLYFLPETLAQTGADILILQEVWTPDAQQTLAAGMQARGYQTFIQENKSLVPPFFLGNGLMVFAKSTIKPAGQPEFRGWKNSAGFDKYAQKGMLKVPLQIDGVGRVDVFNAHTSFLPWNGNQHDYNYAERDTLLSQIKQISDWVASSDASLKLLGADLNTAPFVWDRAKGGFDTTRLNGFYEQVRGVLDDPFALVRPDCRFTCDTWDNDHNNLLANGLFGSQNGNSSLYDPEPNAKYDYVLFRGAGAKVARTGTMMHDDFPLRYNNKMINAPLSDHFAVFTDLMIPLVGI